MMMISMMVYMTYLTLTELLTADGWLIFPAVASHGSISRISTKKGAFESALNETLIHTINCKFSLHINQVFHADVMFEVVVCDYVTQFITFYPLGLQ